MSSRSRAPRASRNALTRRTAEMEGAGHRSAARRSGGRKVERAARGRGASGRSGGAGRGRPGGDRRGSWLKIGLLGLLAGVLSVSGLLVWSLLPGSAGEEGGGSVVIWLDGSDKGQAVERLAEAGLVQSPRLMRLYLSVLLPGVELDAGEHLLRRGLSPRELSARLARLPGRSSTRVALPEGWHRRKIAERLERSEVCLADAFVEASERAELLTALDVAGPSAEGYLFPATYELAHNTPPEDVVRRMVKETRKRLTKLFAKHPGALERLRASHGFGEREVLTLASIVEKETGHGEERPLVASVFLNRLAATDGETRGRLQSDPTAVYGCLYEPSLAPSCAAFEGRVLPAMLRDPANRYNTYRHAGLPPGPIANPGLEAVEAVLAPAQSDYLFFVADGAGRHTFSRTFEEHQRAVSRLRALRTAGSPDLDTEPR